LPRSAGTAIENNFTNALVTEATGLNFPENAVIDALNCHFDERSIVRRRRGFDLEDGFALEALNPGNNVVSTYYWRSAAGNGSFNFLVRQIGRTLRLYRVGSSGALSTTLHPYSVDVEAFKSPGSPGVQDLECRFAAGYGFLFVAHPHLDPFYLAYNPALDTFSALRIDIKIRDFDGAPYTTTLLSSASERPTTLGLDHLYNLRNQGWEEVMIYTMVQQRNFYPSNADVQWLWRTAEGVIKFYVEEQGSIEGNTYKTPYYQDRVARGNTPAPKGHFILNAFYQDRNAAFGYSSIPVVTSGFYRPTTVEFFAGRVFYAGVNAQGFNNKIYFTQILQGPQQIGQCHQLNDPTGEYQFDLLPSDGGVIVIPAIGEIHRLFAMENALIVFASNGVWVVSGSQGTGFAANDYSVRKLTTFTTISSHSFVDAGGLPVWWNYDGIYMLTMDSALGTVQLKNISEQRIKSWFKTIPNSSKRYAKGSFNSLEGTVQWIYRTTEPTTSNVSERYEYDGILNLNVVNGTFSPWKVGNDRVKIMSFQAIQGLGTTDEIVPVTDNLGTQVRTNLLDLVTAEAPVTREYSSVFKYFIKVRLPDNTWRISFAEERRNEYYDWISLNSVYGTSDINYLDDYESHFTTGYRLRGEGIKKFQSHFIQVFTEKSAEPTVYYFQALWDYAQNQNTNRWSSRQRVEIPGAEYKYQNRRLKVRGHGKACQYRFVSESGKPFAFIGWITMDSANQLP
jgi:hypothetical protein